MKSNLYVQDDTIRFHDRDESIFGQLVERQNCVVSFPAASHIYYVYGWATLNCQKLFNVLIYIDLFTVKIRNMGKRYQSKVDISTPYFVTKVQSSVVIKGGKAIVTRTTLDYIVPKVIRDKITINGKGNFAITKALKMLKGTL